VEKQNRKICSGAAAANKLAASILKQDCKTNQGGIIMRRDFQLVGGLSFSSTKETEWDSLHHFGRYVRISQKYWTKMC
jgi:hypothetical protein